MTAMLDQAGQVAPGDFEAGVRMIGDAAQAAALRTVAPVWVAVPGLAVLAAIIGMRGIPFATDPVAPKMERINPVEGLKRMFKMRALVQAFTAGGAPASLLLLGFGRGAATADAFAGQELSGLAPARGGTMPPASGLVAVQIPAGAPLLLVRHGADGLPAAQQGVKLGGASVQAGISAGLPWVAADIRNAVLPDAAAGLAPVLLAALPHAPAQVMEATVSVPFGLGPANWAPCGQVVFEGRAVGFGVEAGSILPGGTGGVGDAVSALQIGRARAGLRGEDLGFAVHGERRRVLIDVAPATPRAACWRLDDTHALVTVQKGGAGSAALRAAELYHALMAGGGLGLLNPGEGFSTWEGSPLWLALARIGKPVVTRRPPARDRAQPSGGAADHGGRVAGRACRRRLGRAAPDPAPAARFGGRGAAA